MQLEFTQQEAESMLQLIDIAIRANGMQIALFGVAMFTKFSEELEKSKRIQSSPITNPNDQQTGGNPENSQ